MTKLSNDSAFSDGSSNINYNNNTDMNNVGPSGMLLRMDLSKNPPVFVQGIIEN